MKGSPSVQEQVANLLAIYRKSPDPAQAAEAQRLQAMLEKEKTAAAVEFADPGSKPETPPADDPHDVRYVRAAQSTPQSALRNPHSK